MGLFGKLFGGSRGGSDAPEDGQTGPVPNHQLAGVPDDLPDRYATVPREQEFDSGFIFRFDVEEPAREAFDRLRPMGPIFPNARVELRKNRPKEDGGGMVSSLPPFVVVILSVFEDDFLEPRQADRLFQGGPIPDKSGSRRHGALRKEMDATEPLDGFDTPRVALRPRWVARHRSSAKETYPCDDCGATVDFKPADVHPVKGLTNACEFCSRKNHICPSIFDSPGEDGLNPAWLERVIPSARWEGMYRNRDHGELL